MPPYLQDGEEFQFIDNDADSFAPNHSSPLVVSSTTFAADAESYGIHATTALILDDVRFLIALTISLPNDPNPQQEQKLRSTASWIHDRIQALPVETPETPGVESHPASSSDMPRGTKPLSTDPRGLGDPVPDYVYQSIRQAALIYTSAIAARRPFSSTCSVDDFHQLWTTVWRVPLTVWKSMLGIFLWIEVAIVAPAKDTPHGRFVKSMLTIAALNLGIENWTASSSALRGAIVLQEKLGSRDREANRMGRIASRLGQTHI